LIPEPQQPKSMTNSNTPNMISGNIKPTKHILTSLEKARAALKCNVVSLSRKNSNDF
jgi:hypothetical protein